MENMENPKKLAVATIAGLTEVAGMAAPAMADETAADPTVGQTQSADPTKDALDKANTAVSESQTAYDNAQQNVQDAQSKVDDAYASDPATNAAQSELDAAQSAKKDADQSAADAQADVDAAQAALAEVNATLKTAETALATAKSDAESAQPRILDQFPAKYPSGRLNVLPALGYSNGCFVTRFSFSSSIYARIFSGSPG